MAGGAWPRPPCLAADWISPSTARRWKRRAAASVSAEHGLVLQPSRDVPPPAAVARAAPGATVPPPPGPRRRRPWLVLATRRRCLPSAAAPATVPQPLPRGAVAPPCGTPHVPTRVGRRRPRRSRRRNARLCGAHRRGRRRARGAAVAVAAHHSVQQRAQQPGGRAVAPAAPPHAGAQPLRVDEEAVLPESTQPRQDANQGQVPSGVQRPSAPGAGEGVPLQPLHHHPQEGRTRCQPRTLRKTGEDLVPEQTRQGEEAGEEARGAAAQGEAGGGPAAAAPSAERAAPGHVTAAAVGRRPGRARVRPTAAVTPARAAATRRRPPPPSRDREEAFKDLRHDVGQSVLVVTMAPPTCALSQTCHASVF